MAKKIQLQDANGNTLHPLTLGECVTMNSGENLDTLMSKSQMFTPTITQDKSMFKVGTGIDVDYSANVKDGAYESLVFKGKSLVNLLTKTIDTTWNLNLENWSIVSTTLSDYVLKPNTTYSVIVYVTEKTCPDRDDLFWVGDVDGKKDKVTHDIVRKNVSLGANVFVINTVPDFSSITSAYRGGINFQGSKFVEGTLKWKAIVLEGDWTNKELPPYFTGLCDVKMPILRNVGKNLFDKNTMKTSWWANQDGVKKDYGNTNYSILVPATQNKVYSVSFDVSNRSFYAFLDKDYNTLLLQTGYVTKTAPQGTKYLLYYLHSENIDLCGDIQLEEATAKTVHEDYKTNILRTSEEIVLREVNGVQDTYKPLTGEYVQRIGEVVLDGSENEWEDWSETSFVLRGSYFSDAVEHTAVTAPHLKCNNMVAGKGETPRTVRYYRSPTVLWTMVGKNNGETLDQFKTWLSQNPTTIHYILAEPVTTIVKPSTMTPFAYQNGHVIVESGFEGQSLLPEIEYSVVTGRTGQVTQNTKVLRQQEQQIIGLEELLLTQVVQMEYERTLLQFDYELQMMMLG